jgi:hypothetical protein
VGRDQKRLTEQGMGEKRNSRIKKEDMAWRNALEFVEANKHSLIDDSILPYEAFQDILEYGNLSLKVVELFRDHEISIRRLSEAIEPSNRIQSEFESSLRYKEEYLLRHIPDTLYQAIGLLILQSYIYTSDVPIRSSILNRLKSLHSSAIWSPDLPMRDGRGGHNREPDYPWDDEKLKAFAYKADHLRSLWEYAIKFFEKVEYDPECLSMLRSKRDFANVSLNLLREAFNGRKSCWENGEKIPPKFSPFAFALEHTRRELNIDREYKFSTLKKRYSEGKDLLKSGKSITSRTFAQKRTRQKNNHRNE